MKVGLFLVGRRARDYRPAHPKSKVTDDARPEPRARAPASVRRSARRSRLAADKHVGSRKRCDFSQSQRYDLELATLAAVTAVPANERM
jgi:hypothetical protein